MFLTRNLTSSFVYLAADEPIRNEFDRLLAETMIRQYTQLEYHLIGLQREIKHFETQPTKEEQARIVAEIEFIILEAERGEQIATQELARKDLNILEKVDFESILKIGQILVKDVRAAEAKVKAVKPTH